MFVEGAIGLLQHAVQLDMPGERLWQRRRQGGLAGSRGEHSAKQEEQAERRMRLDSNGCQASSNRLPGLLPEHQSSYLSTAGRRSFDRLSGLLRGDPWPRALAVGPGACGAVEGTLAPFGAADERQGWGLRPAAFSPTREG